MSYVPAYPPLTPEEREMYHRHNAGTATDLDLLKMATIEAYRAMRSLPPHCLPTEGGLPHNADHANACAHRCWAVLKELGARAWCRNNPTEDPHLAGCTGNGSESCWHCGGEGWVERAFSDDPYDVDTIRCYVCDGECDIRCPGCEARLPPDEVSG